MGTLSGPTDKTRPLAIPPEFIWLKELDSDEQASFISDLLTRILTAITSNNWSPVAEWVEEWKATANVYADPQVARDVKQGLEELDQGDAADWETLRKELGL